MEQKLSLCRVTLKGSDTVEAVVVGSVSVLEVQQNVGLHRGSGVCVCVCVRACVHVCACLCTGYLVAAEPPVYCALSALM